MALFLFFLSRYGVVLTFNVAELVQIVVIVITCDFVVAAAYLCVLSHSKYSSAV